MPLSADGSIDGLNNYDGMSSVSLSNSVAEVINSVYHSFFKLQSCQFTVFKAV